MSTVNKTGSKASPKAYPVFEIAKALPLCDINHRDIETEEIWGNIPCPRKRKRKTINGNIQTAGFRAIKSVDRLKLTNTKTPIDRALKISLEVPAQIIIAAEAKVPII